MTSEEYDKTYVSVILDLGKYQGDGFWRQGIPCEVYEWLIASAGLKSKTIKDFSHGIGDWCYIGTNPILSGPNSYRAPDFHKMIRVNLRFRDITAAKLFKIRWNDLYQ